MDGPMMVKFNEFGRGEPLAVAQARNLGINIVIYLMTLMRSAMGTAARCLGAILASGSQSAAMAGMQTSDEL